MKKLISLVLLLGTMFQSFAQASMEESPDRPLKAGELVYAPLYVFRHGFAELGGWELGPADQANGPRDKIAILGSFGELSTDATVVVAGDGWGQVWTVLGFFQDGRVLVESGRPGSLGILKEQKIFEASILKIVKM